MQASDTHGQAHKNGTLTLLARIVGANAAAVVQADIASIAYAVYLLDDQDPDDRTPVDGHEGASLVVEEVVFNSLQTDAVWDVDATGYNFRHTLDVSAEEAFAVAGRRYLVEYRLTPASGQVIVVRFRINVI